MKPDDVLDHLLSAIVSHDLAATLASFTEDAAVLGSERGEEARGPHGLRAFFERVYAKAGAYRFDFPDRTWTYAEGVAWVVSNGSVREPDAERPKPYRLVGIFRQQEQGWLMALWSGTEPV